MPWTKGGEPEVARSRAANECRRCVGGRTSDSSHRKAPKSRIAGVAQRCSCRHGPASDSRRCRLEKKPQRRSKPAGFKKPRHILLADDGSKEAARAREFAVMLAAATGAKLTAVYVREPIEGPADALHKLKATLAAAAAAKVPCDTVIERPVGITNPGRRILAAARRCHADLIVIGTRGAGLARRLLGSVSTYVASGAHVSVCMIR